MGIDGSVIVLVVILCITVLFAWGSYWDYRKKGLEFEDRRRMIENGMRPPEPMIPPLAGWPGVKQQELQLKYAERRLLIEKGMQPPDDRPVPRKPLTRRDYVRRGVVFVCVGGGMLLAYALLALQPRIDGVGEARAWCLGLGPIVLLFGVGHLLYGRLASAGRDDAAT
jgi:peptidoglycan/LPS O-acetylase OafA/YrhL